jgi:hypothetical protein
MNYVRVPSALIRHRPVSTYRRANGVIIDVDKVTSLGVFRDDQIPCIVLLETIKTIGGRFPYCCAPRSSISPRKSMFIYCSSLILSQTWCPAGL